MSLYLVEYMLFSSRVRVGVRIRIRFSVWLISGYVHVFILLSVVIVTLPKLLYIELKTN